MTLAEAELCCQHQDRSGDGDCEEVTSVRTGEAGGDNCHGLMPGPWSCDLRRGVYIKCLRLGRRQRARVVEDSSGWIIVNQEDCNMSGSESGSDDMPLGAQVIISN